jgi:hypothetical protein
MKYIEVLKDLISIDTTVPPGLNYDKAIDLFRSVEDFASPYDADLFYISADLTKQ